MRLIFSKINKKRIQKLKFNQSQILMRNNKKIRFNNNNKMSKRKFKMIPKTFKTMMKKKQSKSDYFSMNQK